MIAGAMLQHANSGIRLLRRSKPRRQKGGGGDGVEDRDDKKKVAPKSSGRPLFHSDATQYKAHMKIHIRR